MHFNLPPSSVVKLLIWQMAIVLLIAIGLLIMTDVLYAYSALLGGLVCALPNWCFALIAFRHRGVHAAKQIVMGFYLGEAVKLVMTIVLFSLVLVTVTVSPLVLSLIHI